MGFQTFASGVIFGSLLPTLGFASPAPSLTTWGGATLATDFGLSAYAIANRIGAQDGIPALNATDIEFILTEQTLLGVEFPSNRSVQRRSPYSGPNSRQKWEHLKMDEWLEKYVNKVKVHGKSTLLRDSADFFTDFWLSTGEEGECSCANLFGSCAPTSNPSFRTADIGEQDVLKAYFARQVFKVWQEEAKASYQVLSAVADRSDDMINTLHRTVYRDVATPVNALDVLDVLLPTLGIVTTLTPGLSTAAAILSALEVLKYSMVSRRRADEGHGGSGLSETRIQKRQSGDGGVTAADVLRRVKQLEREVTDTQGSINYYTVLDKSAKTVNGFKALYRKVVPGPSPSSWDAFDREIHQVLDNFAHAVGQSFELNSKTWQPKSISNVHANGMRDLMRGGEWAKPKPSTGDITVAISTIKTLFRRIVFMHFVKNQAIYLWTETFPTEFLCREAALKYASERLIPDALTSHHHCFADGSSWVFVAARRPYKHKGGSSVEQVYDGALKSGDFIKLGKVSEKIVPNGHAKSHYYVQERTSMLSDAGFDKSSARVDFWKGESLDAMKLELTPQQIYQLSKECANVSSGASHHDPWSRGPRNFYPPMSIKASDLLEPNAPPTCLINIPIYSHMEYSVDNEWCKDHVGSVEDGTMFSAYFLPRGDWCRADHELLGLRADIAICDSDMGEYGESRVSRPGCQDRERGVQIVAQKA